MDKCESPPSSGGLTDDRDIVGFLESQAGKCGDIVNLAERYKKIGYAGVLGGVSVPFVVPMGPFALLGLLAVTSASMVRTIDPFSKKTNKIGQGILENIDKQSVLKGHRSVVGFLQTQESKCQDISESADGLKHLGSGMTVFSLFLASSSAFLNYHWVPVVTACTIFSIGNMMSAVSGLFSEKNSELKNGFTKKIEEMKASKGNSEHVR